MALESMIAPVPSELVMPHCKGKLLAPMQHKKGTDMRKRQEIDEFTFGDVKCAKTSL
jgi:hypothetical protein